MELDYFEQKCIQTSRQTMNDILKLQKKELKAKKLEFERLALTSYGAYLREKYKISAKQSSKIQYTEYLAEEISRNDLKISEIDKTLL